MLATQTWSYKTISIQTFFLKKRPLIHNTLHPLDKVIVSWSYLHEIVFVRCYVSTAVLDGLIYAMGGYDGQNRQNTAERYFPKKNQWSLIQPMNFQRSDASATAFDGKCNRS